jgi:hypothetical protein
MGTTNCHDCGCGPSIPEPCITPPPVCPDPQPCTEVIDAQCVVYTTPPTVGAAALRTVSAYAAPETKSVAQAITELENRPVAIQIPELKVGTMQGDVFASLNFYESSDWLNHNPRIFLFKSKKTKKPNTSYNETGRPNQFVHPVHLDPSKTTNKKWWNGTAQYADGPVILRNTEFEIPNVAPYQKFNLTLNGLDKYQWVTFVGQDNSTCDNGINIYIEVNGQGFGQTYTAVGAMNGYPYYELYTNDLSFIFAFNPNYNGYVLYETSKHTIDNPCIVPNSSSAVSGCPLVGGLNNNSYSIINYPDSSNGLLFNNFTINGYEPTQFKRQSTDKDFNKKTYEDSIGLTFRMNGSQKFFGAMYYNQKIYFKLAIVIDNPNPTADIPYLIGPMSETFVLKFSIEKEGELGLRFVNNTAHGAIVRATY